MTGSQVQENVPVPVAAKRQDANRRRFNRRGDQSSVQRNTQRRAAAAIMGMAESDDDESIIPDDATGVDSLAAEGGIKMDREAEEQDREPDQPASPVGGGEGNEDEESDLIPPRAALVAPDVTPHTLEPIDPSEVPAPAHAAQAAAPGPTSTEIDPMSVLLGRPSRRTQEAPLPDSVVTAESVQSTVNATLGLNTPADLLRQGQELPAPQPGDGKHIMEAFYRFGPKRTSSWG